MYSIGSLFYAIYFFVSFPMFMRLDEQAGGRRWSLREVRRRTLDTLIIFSCW
jgi:cycloeucalenol cycloisomerase